VAAPVARSRAAFPWPLAGFLLLVGAAVAAGWLQANPRPDLAGAMRELADGDLDGSERTRMLQRVQTLAAAEAGPTARWATVLAAVALEDRAGHAAALARLGAAVPDPGQRADLGLGEPLLVNLLAAGLAEASGQLGEARRCWQRVASAARLARRPFARELAEQALARLPASGR
jgi:hypothetical protein